MGKIIAIYGLPASGKTTQAGLINEKYGLYQFGMGDKLREEINSGSELGKKAKEKVENGLLVPDEIIKGILKNVQKQAKETGIVFDGFPRMLAQAELLEEILAEINLEINLFVLLRIDPREAERRISNRAKNGKRSDDISQKVINNRIKVFRQESIPLISYYKTKGKFIEINGELDILEVFAEIDKHL